MRARAWVAGNRVELLENGEAYYPRLIEAINQAKSEVIVETFIIFEDKVGTPVQQALIAAARRGLRVELTVDGYGSADLTPEFIGALTEAGVGFHVYRPQPRVMGYRTNLFRRLHRKIVVIDGQLAFVGGINISHDHVADFGPRSKQDYAVEVEGPVVADIHRFVEKALSVPELEPDTRRRWWHRWRASTVMQRPSPRGSVRALFTVRDNGRHMDDIERHYRIAIRAARERIVIANAYFFPGYRLLRGLRRAARRGVDVKLILQGKPDMPIAKLAAESLYRHLARAGVTIYEYCERPLHAKVAVVDDEWATVGSSNLDPLSLYLNLESNLVFLDAGFNRTLAGRLDHLMEHCCQKVDMASAPRPRLWKQMLGYAMYHLGRRFPTWIGWRPAHAGRLGLGETS